MTEPGVNRARGANSGIAKKVCRTRTGAGCGELKPRDDFRDAPKMRDGKRSTCRPCEAAVQSAYHATPEGQAARARYRERLARGEVSGWTYEQSEAKRIIRRKQAWDIKVAAGCADCGLTDGRVLDFDHVRGEKVLAVSVMIDRNWSWDKVEAEIAKCEVRCRNCHHIATAERAGWRKNWNLS